MYEKSCHVTKANSLKCILSYKMNLSLPLFSGVPYGNEKVVKDTKLHLCVAFRTRSSIWQMENRVLLIALSIVLSC